MDYQAAFDRAGTIADELARLLDGFSLEGCELVVSPYITETTDGDYAGFAAAAWKTRIGGHQYGYVHVVCPEARVSATDAAITKATLITKLAETRRLLAA